MRVGNYSWRLPLSENKDLATPWNHRRLINMLYYIAGSAGGQGRPFLVSWLATWTGSMGPYCPLGIARFDSVLEKKIYKIRKVLTAVELQKCGRKLIRRKHERVSWVCCAEKKKKRKKRIRPIPKTFYRSDLVHNTFSLTEHKVKMADFNLYQCTKVQRRTTSHSVSEWFIARQRRRLKVSDRDD